MELPSVEDVRKRIWNVPDESIRYCLMTAYLFAGRISEVVGRKCPSRERVQTIRSVCAIEVYFYKCPRTEGTYEVLRNR